MKAVKFLLLALLFCCTASTSFAIISVTPASGGTSICPNLAVGGSTPGYTTLGDITITEGFNSDFSLGTDQIILNLPVGWQFNTGAVPTFAFTTGADISGMTLVSFTSTSITIDVTCSDVAAHDAFSVGNLQVQATSTSSPSGYIYSTTSLGILGVTTGVAGTNFGNLALTSSVTASVTISVFPVGPVCTGTGITFTPAPINGGLSPAYQWFVNDVLLGTGTTYSSSILHFGDRVYCTMTSSLGCVIPPAVNSDTLLADVVSPPMVQTVGGGGSFCPGGTGVHITLSGSEVDVNYQAYLGFTPVGPLVAGTGSALDMGLYTAVGTYTVVAATAAAGCNATMAGSATVSTLVGPTQFTVTGSGAYCFGSAGRNVGLSGSQTGVTYELYLGGTTPIVGPVSGTGSALDFGPMTIAGEYTVVATDPALGCTSVMLGSAIISVSPLPVSTFNVIGGGHYCAGGSGNAVGLDGSEVGVNYQLYLDGAVVVAPMAGTGGPLTFGIFTGGGTYTVIGTNITTLCSSNMTGSVTITIDPLPGLFTITGGGGYCIGGTGADIQLSGSESGVNYQLFNGPSAVGAAIAGTGSALDFGPQPTAGTYSVVATNTTTSCSVTMTGTVTVSINTLPTVFAITGGGATCEGTPGADVSMSSSETGVNYQLYLDGVAVGSPVAGATGVGISFGPQPVAGAYTAVAFNATTSCSVNMLGSVTVTVNPAPTHFSMLGGGAFCAGGTGVDISFSGSQTGVTYQLYNGATAVGAPIAGTGSGFDLGIQTTAGTYIMVATNDVTGCVDTMDGSAVIIVNALPIAYTMTGGGTYCVGGGGVDIGLSNSEVGVSYEIFYIGTIPLGVVAGTGSAIDFGNQYAPGAYNVVATNMSSGCTNDMAGSATIDTLTLPTAYTVTGGGSYCSGGTGVDVGLSFSDAGITYQLLNTFVPSSVPMLGLGAALDYGLQTAAGFYTVVATNTATGCTNDMLDGVAVTILPLPDIFNVIGGGEFCAGSAGAHIGLDNSVSGINYELLIDGDSLTIVAGTGGPIDFGLVDTAGFFTVLAIDAASLCTSNMTGSAIITVDPLPNVFFVTGGGFYCAGGTGVDVGLTGSDASVNYQLFVDGTATGPVFAGTGSGGIDFGNQTVAGTYTVEATNTITGCVNLMSGSVSVTINPVPAVMGVTGGGSDCAGGTGVDVALVSSVVGINYQLYINGVATGAPLPGTGVALDFGLQTTTGTAVIIATDAITGCSDSMANTVYVYIAPIPTVYTISAGGFYCAGTAGMDLTLSGSDTGVTYQLYFGGSPLGAPVLGTGSVLDFGFQTAAGSYTVVATNVYAPCTAPMDGTATVSINPAPTVYTVTGGALYCTTVTGADVSLSGSDAGINYQLLNGAATVGLPVAGTGIFIDFGIQMAVGIYKVVATDGTTGCSDTMSGSAIIAIIGYPVVDVIAGPDTICQYSTVTYTDDSTGGNWTSSNPVVATVEPGTGVVSALVPGSTILAYTVTNAGSCSTIVTLNVTVAPAPFVDVITGPANVCASMSVSMSDVTTGGNWSTSDITIATVSAGGVVHGISPGSVTISYTVPGTPCSTSATKAFTVGDAIPASTLLPPGPLTLCNGVPVYLYDTTVGGGIGLSYQWFNTGVLLTGATDRNYTATIPGLYTISVSNGTCSEVLPAINVLPQPNAVITLDTAANLLFGGSFTRWQWYLNGTPIPGATANYYPDDNVPGDTYTVIVWDINNCTDTSDGFVVPGGLVHVNTVYSGKDIKIYPNPATSVLYIDAPLKVLVSILTPDGKALIDRKEAISINVAHLPDGMYMIMVYDENNNLLKTDKFVKME